MKKQILRFLGVCGLLFLVLDCGLAQTPETSVVHASSVDNRSLAPASAQMNKASEYYVDCGAGSSDGEGRSPASAWPALDEVNRHTFSPGDIVYLKRETTCHGMLWPKGSGSASSVIRLSAYGKGKRPRVIAGKGQEEAFRLFDQQYWDVDSIEFTGGTLFGVFISGQSGVLHHIHLRNLLAHDVFGGEVKHKESGLVVISPGKVEQHFDDVLVEGVTAYGTDQWAGILVGGGNFGDVEDKDWNTNVVVRNSVVHDLYGDGIILFRVKNGLIDSSAAWRIGMQTTQSIGTPNAIWTWMCQDCVVSHNEAFLTDSPGVDGGAFDIDYGNTRNAVVGNYGHDTQGYCIAVFAAGYVTHDSVVERNLCVNNGESPRLARYQGAIFLWTWNNGVIDNLRIEDNAVYWNPPGNLPALINRGDIQGAQRVFERNQIYSSASNVIESEKNLAFQNNRYFTCSEKAMWTFGKDAYANFQEYRNSSGQELGSTWTADPSSPSCRPAKRSPWTEPVGATRTAGSGSSGRGAPPGRWTIASDIPVGIDADGLLDYVSAGQLMVLKNLYAQFRSSGLVMKVRLEVERQNLNELLQNVVTDLGMSEVEIITLSHTRIATHPNTRIIAPDGSIAKTWQGFVGPSEIGLAVREPLGRPDYSQMALDTE